MRTLVILALASTALAGTRSILQTDGGSFDTAALNATAPASAPYTTAGDERIELRLSGYDTAATSNDWIVFFHSCLLVERRASDQLLRVSDQCDGNQSNDIALDISTAAWSGKDLVARVQRVMSTRTFTVGVWTAQRTTYLSGSNGFGDPSANDRNYRNGALRFGGQRASGKLAWVRWYSTTVAEVQNTPPLETGPTGDLGDWEFEDGGSGTITCASSTAYDDGSGNTLTITTTGTQTCSDTPVYNPYVSAGAHVTAVVGQSSALAGSCTPLNGSATTTLLWTQNSGPNTLTLSSTAVAAPTFSNQVETLTGKAAYHLTFSCTDSSANNSTATTIVGAVPVDASDNINYSAIYPSMFTVLGPIARTTPWGYFNVGDLAISALVSTTMQDAAYRPSRGTALGTGTVNVDSSGRIVCTNPCTSGLTGGSPGTFLFVGWTPPGESAGSGNMNIDVGSVQNSTTFTPEQLPGTLCASPPCSNVASEIYLQPADTATYSATAWGMRGGSSSNNWNYYDTLMALQRTWLRTGDDTYYAGISAMCSDWWAFSLDHGYAGPIPRVRALGGIMGCFEINSYTNGWSPLSSNFIIPQFSQQNYNFPATNFQNTDDREAGYGVRDAANASILDPNAGRKTAYCSNLNTTLANISNGLTVIDADHAFPNQDEYSLNSSYPYVSYSPYQGNSGWRVDIPLQGLKQLYESYHSASGCNDSGKAATTLELARKVINWVRDYALYTSAGHKAVWYDVGYLNNAQTGTAYISGTASGTNGSAAIVGTGSAFLSELTVGGYIGFATPTASLLVGQVYEIAAIADDTHLTLTVPYPNASFSGSTPNISSTITSSTSCGDSLADHCNADPSGVFNLTRLLPMIFGWYAYRSGDSSYLTVGDALFSSAFGGPADGPGGSLACSGPGCSATYTDWPVLLPSCGSSPPPCYPYGGGISNLGKNFAQGTGAAGGVTYVGYRNLVGAPTVSGSSLSGKITFSRNVVIH